MDESFDLLGLGDVADQDGVLGFHEDEVADAEQSDVFVVLGKDDVAGCVPGDDGCVGGIMVFVMIEVFGYGCPCAEVVPVEGGLHDEDAVGFFHDGVVYGNFWEFWEVLDESRVEVLSLVSFGDEGGDFWC